jgi:hypothetical protein
VGRPEPSSAQVSVQNTDANPGHHATAVHEIKNLELYERVLNLNAGIMDLAEENRRLRAEVEEVRKMLTLRENMNFKEPFYYQEGDEVPFCPSCFESKNPTAVHVIFDFNRADAITWHCPTCKNQFIVKKDRSEKGSARANFRTSQWG